jgi:hypothetical protein
MIKASTLRTFSRLNNIPSTVAVYASCQHLCQLRKTRFRWWTKPCRTGLVTCRVIKRCFNLHIPTSRIYHSATPLRPHGTVLEPLDSYGSSVMVLLYSSCNYQLIIAEEPGLLPMYEQHGFLLPFSSQPLDSFYFKFPVLPHAPFNQPSVDVCIDLVH